MKTLVVIPTYNEKENIIKLIPAVLSQFEGADILVVDDNSPDGTGDIVKKITEDESRVALISREGKQGLASAYIAGFRWGMERGYKIICEFDADFSHKPEYLEPMRELIVAGSDFVIGSRYIKGGDVENWGLVRKITSRGGSLYAKMILGGGINDLTGGFNMWKTEVLDNMPYDDFISKGYLFQIEMKHRARKMGYSGKEFPIIFPDRTVGDSKMSGGIFVEALKEVWKIKMAVR